MSIAAANAPAEALAHCGCITRSRARNFYYGLKLLPEPKRSAMYALYAWMREVDDLVDSGDAQRNDLAGRIAEFRRRTTLALAGNPPPGEPMWEGLAFAAEHFDLGEEQFQTMIDGQLDDLNERRYRTFEELREYCYCVASTVGLLCIRIWGYSDPAAEHLAIERGIAFQLTNILRDYREDYDGGRVYLPEEDFEAYGLSPRDLREWCTPRTCSAFVEAQVTRVASFYARSAQLDDLIHPECKPTLWAMTAIYRGLLAKVGAQPMRLVSARRIRLSCLQKSMIVLRARAGRFHSG